MLELKSQLKLGLNDVLVKLDKIETVLGLSPKTDYFDEDHEKFRDLTAKYNKLAKQETLLADEIFGLYQETMQVLADMGVKGKSVDDYTNTRLRPR